MKIAFAPQMPRVYEVRDADNPGRFPNGKRWMTWGWCSLLDLTSTINASYNLYWPTYMVLERFGVTSPSRDGITPSPSPLIIFRRDKFTYDPPVQFDFRMLEVIKQTTWDPMLPAGWAKAVLWAIEQGGRRLVKLPPSKVYGVAEEDGTLVGPYF